MHGGLPYPLPALPAFGAPPAWMPLGLPLPQPALPPKAAPRPPTALGLPPMPTPRRASPSPNPRQASPSPSPTPGAASPGPPSLPLPKSPSAPALAIRLSKTQLKGLIKAWPTLASEAKQAYRDSCPQYFANPKLVALLQEAEETHQRRHAAAAKPAVDLLPLPAGEGAGALREEEAEAVPEYFRPPVADLDLVPVSPSPTHRQVIALLAQQSGLQCDIEVADVLHIAVQRRLCQLLQPLMLLAAVRADVYRRKTRIRAEAPNPQWALPPPTPPPAEPAAEPDEAEPAAKRQKVAADTATANHQLEEAAPSEESEVSDLEQELQEQCDLLQRKWDELQDEGNDSLLALLERRLHAKRLELEAAALLRREGQRRDRLGWEEAHGRRRLEEQAAATAPKPPAGPAPIPVTAADLRRWLPSARLREAPHLLDDLLARTPGP
eukprot:EG_transcript_11209